MPNQIDHYDYWNKIRKKENQKEIALEREIIPIQVINKILKNTIQNKNLKILDAGCGNGKFLRLLKSELNKNLPLGEELQNVSISGIDLSKSEITEAIKSGIKAEQADFSKKLKYKDGEFDLIYSGEVIEHLYNPDFFLKELNRILKPGGILILTTPNLLAWFNRLLVIIGQQPLFTELSTESKLIGSGILRSLKKDKNTVGHVRIFNKHAIKDILTENNFEVIKIMGCVTEEGFPKWFKYVDKIFTFSPGLSSNLIVIARKKL